MVDLRTKRKTVTPGTAKGNFGVFGGGGTTTLTDITVKDWEKGRDDAIRFV